MELPINVSMPLRALIGFWRSSLFRKERLTMFVSMPLRALIGFWLSSLWHLPQTGAFSLNALTGINRILTLSNEHAGRFDQNKVSMPLRALIGFWREWNAHTAVNQFPVSMPLRALIGFWLFRTITLVLVVLGLNALTGINRILTPATVRQCRGSIPSQCPYGH